MTSLFHMKSFAVSPRKQSDLLIIVWDLPRPLRGEDDLDLFAGEGVPRRPGEDAGPPGHHGHAHVHSCTIVGIPVGGGGRRVYVVVICRK